MQVIARLIFSQDRSPKISTCHRKLQAQGEVSTFGIEALDS